MTITYFGKPRDAPIYQDIPQVPTPVGASCGYCGEDILMGEDGFLDSNLEPFHRECWIRMIVGSVAHQSEVCSCFMGPSGFQHNPPDQTRRQAAKLALAYHERRRYRMSG